MPIAAAIFDMDGLLVDSEPVWHEVEIEVFGRYGVPLTVERCLETKGMYLGDAVAYWYARLPWQGPDCGDVAVEILDAMAERLERGVSLKPGAEHALDFCRARGARLTLASSSPRRLIDVVVRRLGLGSRFAVLRSGEDEVSGKPDPAIFLSVAGELGVEPRHCVVFEDSPAGVSAALAAGMACVAVPESDGTGPGSPDRPHPRRDSLLAGADAALAGADEVLAGADVVLGSLAELDDTVWRRLIEAAARR
jgi:mannitol-1-/sugar-/sorbitol-6-/2-deoxyglucose-6-phosphatase